MEPNVVIRVRQIDQSLVESIFSDIQNTYTSVFKQDIALKVDPDNFLPAESCGGVELIAHKGKLKKKLSIFSIKINYFINFKRRNNLTY